MESRSASPEDVGAIKRLLNACGLPSSDIDGHLDHFILAWDDDVIVGVVGLEIHETDGLLRSLAVAPHLRGQGLGRDLCLQMIRHASEQGVRALHLLTETAEEFCRRLGFEVVHRDALSPQIRSTEQFARLCPASATAMSLPLGVGERQPLSGTYGENEGGPEPSRSEVLEFHRVFSELIRKYQFRDRRELTCEGMSVSQCHTLEVIGDAGQLSIGEVAARLHLSVSTVSRLVDHIVEAGLAVRQQDPENRRVWHVSLSPAGLALHGRIRDDVLKREGEALSGLAPERRRALVEGLEAISAAVDSWRTDG